LYILYASTIRETHILYLNVRYIELSYLQSMLPGSVNDLFMLEALHERLIGNTLSFFVF